MPFYCQLCGKAYAHRQSLYTHRRRKHPEMVRSYVKKKKTELQNDGEEQKTISRCPLCPRKLSNSYSLARHMAMHKDHRMKFSCSTCHYIGWSKTDIQQHMFREKHGSIPMPDRYRCHNCGYTTLRMGNLTRHMEVCKKPHGISSYSTISMPPKLDCIIAGCGPDTQGCERCTDYDGRYVLDDEGRRIRESEVYSSWRPDFGHASELGIRNQTTYSGPTQKISYGSSRVQGGSCESKSVDYDGPEQIYGHSRSGAE